VIFIITRAFFKKNIFGKQDDENYKEYPANYFYGVVYGRHGYSKTKSLPINCEPRFKEVRVVLYILLNPSFGNKLWALRKDFANQLNIEPAL
jgi:hypothetical protein